MLYDDNELDILDGYNIGYHARRKWCRKENLVLGLIILNTVCLCSLMFAFAFVAVPAYEMRTFWQKHKENFEEISEVFEETKSVMSNVSQFKNLIVDKILPMICRNPYTRKYLGSEWCANGVFV